MSGRSLLLAVAVALVPAVWGPALVLSMREPAPPAAPGGAGTTLDAAGSEARSELLEVVADGPPPVDFASGGGVVLALPATRVRGVAFHEAALPGAVPLQPFGRCGRCRHHRFVPPPPDGSGLHYAVLPPRGRGSPPTSAVDVVVGRRAVVRSPVTGTVRTVERYRLYGRYPDVRVQIRPDGAPGIAVVLLHLERVTLGPGDRVEAGSTEVGGARRLPFRSQVDRLVDGGFPHVHLEVVDARARRQAQKQG